MDEILELKEENTRFRNMHEETKNSIYYFRYLS